MNSIKGTLLEIIAAANIVELKSNELKREFYLEIALFHSYYKNEKEGIVILIHKWPVLCLFTSEIFEESPRNIWFRL